MTPMKEWSGVLASLDKDDRVRLERARSDEEREIDSSSALSRNSSYASGGGATLSRQSSLSSTASTNSKALKLERGDSKYVLVGGT